MSAIELTPGVRHLFLMRHAETAENLRLQNQTPDVSITSYGRAHAAAVGAALAAFPISRILTSDYTRAMQTAREVGAQLSLIPEPTTLLRETAPPVSVYGNANLSVASVRYLIWLWGSQNEAASRDVLHGAESLYHIHRRVQELRTHLETHAAWCTLAVSHTLFMNLFREMVSTSPPLPCWRATRGLCVLRRVPNAGIVHFTYAREASTGAARWRYRGKLNIDRQ